MRRVCINGFLFALGTTFVVSFLSSDPASAASTGFQIALIAVQVGCIATFITIHARMKPFLQAEVFRSLTNDGPSGGLDSTS